MIVMKFGGTSVEDAAALSRVAGIISAEAGRPPLVVVSACSGVTNDLLKAAATVRDGDRDKALAVADRLRVRHRTIASGLLGPERLDEALPRIDEYIQELRNYIRGIHLLGEMTDRTLDAVTGFGELLSSLLLYYACLDRGLPAVLVDARSVIRTDAVYTAANPDMEEIRKRADAIVSPLVAQQSVIITQGFIGSAPDGSTTTIGRGGSDHSASLFGAALNASEIQIWTDVDGMMTSDPRTVPAARLIRTMSFTEASELAYFGAKVLHPKTILPAVERKIPVRILNSRRPGTPGTVILQDPSAGSRTPGEQQQVTAIASKRGILIINISSSRMLMAHGFLARLFAIFEEYRKSVDVIATSEVSVSLTVDSEDNIPGILEALGTIGEVRISRGKAIVCVVGEGMRRTPGIAARIFNALAAASVNIEMISEGASEINLTLVVDQQDSDAAVRVLHREFFEAA